MTTAVSPPAAEANGLAVVRDQRDPFTVMDSWDDEVLLAEMQGAIAKSLVYEFKQGGETITGLSKVGVDECCLVLSEQGQVIREEDVTYTLIGEDVTQQALFKAKAARYAVSPTGEILLDVVVGVKRQPLYDMRKGALQLNPFWFETGAMKAVRNARFRLIPAKVREGVIAEAKRKGKVRSNDPAPKDEKNGTDNGQAKAEAEPAKGREMTGDEYRELMTEANKAGLQTAAQWQGFAEKTLGRKLHGETDIRYPDDTALLMQELRKKSEALK